MPEGTNLKQHWIDDDSVHDVESIKVTVLFQRYVGKIKINTYTVDSRYLEIEGTLKNSSRYPYFDISDL